MLDARTLDELDRGLLDLAWNAGLGPALALWRKLELPAIEHSGWSPLLSRGPEHLLPCAAMVRAALEHQLDEHLPFGASVHASCGGNGRVALVVAAAAVDNAGEIANALLGLHAALGAGLRSDETALPRPLPSPGFSASNPENETQR
jgi:hypothetical protein